MNRVKISNKKPPGWILKAVKKQFGVEWESGVIFTYGELITNYYGEMGEDLMAHEPHHTKQQEGFGGPKKWWKEYLENKEFRFSQELECYQKQYGWLLKNIKNRETRNKYLMQYARALSGEMYGRVVGFPEAYRQIKL